MINKVKNKMQPRKIRSNRKVTEIQNQGDSMEEIKFIIIEFEKGPR